MAFYLSEWVWYSNTCEEQRLSHTSRLCSLAMLRAKLRDHAQRSDQLALHAPFAEDFEGYNEPEASMILLKAGHAYLPYTARKVRWSSRQVKLTTSFDMG